MILLLATTAVLTLSGQDPHDPTGEVIRTATAPQVSAEAVASQGVVEADAEASPQDPAPHNLTTDQQIARWLEAAPSVPATPGDAYAGPVDGIAWDSERRVRSEFSVGIGTEGYRQYGASVSVPLGDSGRLELHYSEVKNGYPAYGYGGYGYGYDPDWIDPVITPWRSEIGLAPIDSRLEDGPDRRRAYRDYGRMRRAESER